MTEKTYYTDQYYLYRTRPHPRNGWLAEVCKAGKPSVPIDSLQVANEELAETACRRFVKIYSEYIAIEKQKPDRDYSYHGSYGDLTR